RVRDGGRPRLRPYASREPVEDAAVVRGAGEQLDRQAAEPAGAGEVGGIERIKDAAGDRLAVGVEDSQAGHSLAVEPGRAGGRARLTTPLIAIQDARLSSLALPAGAGCTLGAASQPRRRHKS